MKTSSDFETAHMPQVIVMSRGVITLCLCLIFFIGFTANVTAQTQNEKFQYRILERETTVNNPVAIVIEVVNAASSVPKIKQVPGLRYHISPFRSTKLEIINGVQKRVTIRRYTIFIIPFRMGKFDIPPVKIEVDGVPHQTEAFELLVTQSTKDDEFFLRLIGPERKVYIGEVIDLTLEVNIKSYFSRRLNRYLTAEEMLFYMDWSECELGMFFNLIIKREATPTRTRVEMKPDAKGKRVRYYVYEYSMPYTLTKLGAPDIQPIMMRLHYPMGVRPVSRFSPNRQSVEYYNHKNYTAEVWIPQIDAQPLPDAGKPEDFNGAVGEMEVSAFVNPPEVSVGDPLTLNMLVVGGGPAPRLDKVHALTENFRVRDTPQSGQVYYDGKLYTWKIVPKSDSVNEIPPLPYSYFDPATETYQTVYTKALPINVNTADDFDLNAVLDEQQAARRLFLPPRERWMSTSITGSSGIIVTMINTFKHPGVIAGSAGVGALLAMMLLIVRPGARRTEAYELQQRENELIKHLDKVDESELPEALMDYVRFKLNLQPGVTVEEILAGLESRGLDSDLIQDVSNILATINQNEYMPQTLQHETVSHNRRHVVDLVKKLRSYSWRSYLLLIASITCFMFMTGGASARVMAEPQEAIMSPEMRALLIEESRQAFEQGMDLRSGSEELSKQRFDTAFQKLNYVQRNDQLSAEEWFNLGNAAYHSGRKGEAIGAWLKSHEMDPNNVLPELAIAETHDELGVSWQVPIWEQLTRGLPIWGWGWLAFSGWILCLSFIVVRVYWQHWSMIVSASVMLLIALIMCIPILGYRVLDQRDQVVIAEEIEVQVRERVFGADEDNANTSNNPAAAPQGGGIQSSPADNGGNNSAPNEENATAANVQVQTRVIQLSEGQIFTVRQWSDDHVMLRVDGVDVWAPFTSLAFPKQD